MTQGGLHQQIEFLRFFLVAGLVMLHFGPLPGSDLSPFRGWQPSAQPIATFLNSFVLFFFLSAVPLLSAISGWLFFKNFTNTPSFYLGRIRARSRTILLPMVLWSLLVMGAFSAAALVTSDGRILSVVAYDVTGWNFKDVINAVFGITRHPINFQFWFLRDLFLTVLLAPALGLALSVAPLVGAGALCVVWLSDFDFWIFFRTDVLFFFYIGGLLRVWNVDVAHAAPRRGIAMFCLFMVLVAARTIGPHFIPEAGAAGTILFEIGSRIMRAVGVVALWLVAPVIVATAPGRAIAALGSVAFFLHAFHWPLNQFVKHGLAMLLPSAGDTGMIFIYLATGTVTIALSIAAGAGLQRLWPSLYHILSGGRADLSSRSRRMAAVG